MHAYRTDLHCSKTIHLNYLIHLPEGLHHHSGIRWPTILFLHGLGESGDDPTRVMQQGLPRHLAERPDFPFIVIAPQCPWGTWWPELADALAQLLAKCSASHPIDPQRLYLTGLSMGGFGTWYLGTLWPERFAALAPICGGGYWFHGFPQRVAALVNVPVWAFHGAQDTVVPLTDSQELVDTLKAYGGNVRFTVYPEAGHDSWTATYGNPELYAWFLRNVRG
jgi:predicted peptidase